MRRVMRGPGVGVRPNRQASVADRNVQRGQRSKWIWTLSGGGREERRHMGGRTIDWDWILEVPLQVVKIDLVGLQAISFPPL
jgi:hypothetical protein